MYVFSEQLEVNGAVDTLGNFLVSEQFSCQTTHVVCGAQRRTLNLLQAIVHGCWVLSYDWVCVLRYCTSVKILILAMLTILCDLFEVNCICIVLNCEIY